MGYCTCCGAVLDSTNECPAQSCSDKGPEMWVEHYADVMGIDSLRPRFVAKLMDAGRVKDPTDLYTIEQSELVKLTGADLPTAKQILRELEATKSLPIAKVIESLGIAQMTTTAAQSLALSYPDLWALAGADEPSLIRAIGMSRLPEQIRLYFQRPDIMDIITNLEAFGIGRPGIGTPGGSRNGKSIRGKRVCFTGTLQSMVRDEAHRLVEQVGGYVDKTVTRATDVLIVVPEDAGNSKLKKATDYGTDQWTEDEFLAAAGTNPMQRRR